MKQKKVNESSWCVAGCRASMHMTLNNNQIKIQNWYSWSESFAVETDRDKHEARYRIVVFIFENACRSIHHSVFSYLLMLISLLGNVIFYLFWSFGSRLEFSLCHAIFVTINEEKHSGNFYLEKGTDHRSTAIRQFIPIYAPTFKCVHFSSWNRTFNFDQLCRRRHKVPAIPYGAK